MQANKDASVTHRKKDAANYSTLHEVVHPLEHAYHGGVLGSTAAKGLGKFTEGFRRPTKPHGPANASTECVTLSKYTDRMFIPRRKGGLCNF